MTIEQVNTEMGNKETLVFMDEDMREIKIEFNSLNKFLIEALELAKKKRTFYSRDLNNKEIGYDNYQCDIHKNRSIHDLYLLYRHYNKTQQLTFSEFNTKIPDFTKIHPEYKFFRCDNIGNLVLCIAGRKDRYTQLDKFNYTMTDYLDFETE